MKKTKSTALVVWLVIFYLLLPLALTFLYSVFTEWNEVLPSGFTLAYYGRVLSNTVFLMALLRSIVISIIPILLVTACLLLVMYVTVVYLPRLDRYVQMVCTIPYAIQGVILAISILGLYADAPEPFSNRILMLTAAYSVIVLPYMYQGMKNSLQAINAIRLIEAAQMLGTSRFYAFFRLVVPNILPGITISAMLSMAMIFGDFVVVNIVGGSYYETAQIYLQRMMFQSGQATSAVIMLLFLAAFLITAGVWYLQGKTGQKKEE